MAIPKKPSAMDIFGKAAKSVDAKDKKSKTPHVTAPALQGAINDWIQADGDLKDAQARKETAELAILPQAENLRIDECRREGKFHSSIKLGGEKTVLVSTQNKYSKVDSANRETLEEAFGDKTDEYFKAKMEIELTEEALKDEGILQKLIAAVGQENLAKYFKVEQFIMPTETLHEARATDPEIEAKAKTLMDAGILKPYKASVKRS